MSDATAAISFFGGPNAFTDAQMFDIFFFYGLAFILLGAIIFLKRAKIAAANLTGFYYLGAFGIVHGVVEWIDTARIWMKINGMAANPALDSVKMFLLLASFALLLQFGISILINARKVPSGLKWLPAGAGVAFFAITAAAGTFMASELLIRYLFAFTGSLATAIGFLVLRASIPATDELKEFRNGSLWLAFAFAVYAVFGGLVTFTIMDVPPQFVRMLCALAIAYHASSILSLFKFAPNGSAAMNAAKTQQKTGLSAAISRYFSSFVMNLA